MRKLFLYALAIPCFVKASAQISTISVHNPTASQRQELIAIDTVSLGFSVSQGVILRDAFGIERATQLTHDGRLLMDVHVRPHGTATFTIQAGKPAPVRSWVGGRQYPERLDDIAFENDRIGFRLYGPALQRKGEKGFGHDVWVKRTPELILDELYRNDPTLSFHLDYGKGLDCYGVGPTLGCGTPALIFDGIMRFPWCYATYRILDKGPLRFCVQVDFPTTAEGTTEHRILTLDKGSNFCEASVWYDGLLSLPDSGRSFQALPDIAAGFAIRQTDTTTVVKGPDYIHYADPTIDPDRHQTQIYVALIFPDLPVDITVQENHGLGILRNYRGGRFHYYFGAAWSEFDVRSQTEWQSRIDGFMLSKKNPLVINIVK